MDKPLQMEPTRVMPINQESEQGWRHPWQTRIGEEVGKSLESEKWGNQERWSGGERGSQERWTGGERGGQERWSAGDRGAQERWSGDRDGNERWSGGDRGQDRWSGGDRWSVPDRPERWLGPDRHRTDEAGSREGTMSRESSRDDLASMCEQQFEYEDRFRVDRRKLELMMLGSADIGESAAVFFERIGNETATCVIWPSRLKIGAKSKKDPHIRVGGVEEGVKKAKMLIMEQLDTKTNSRVTMKMDVSYTDHSHIIGKGGNTIRRVMAETNCHIHFPDSNRSNPNEKSNQVSIAGEMDGVERARSRVRELTPLLFHFDLPIVPSFQAPPDPQSHYLRAIQDQYNIQIMFRQKQKNFHTTTVVIKGCEWEGSRVKEATLLLMDHLCHQMAASVPVVMTMEISPQHHSVVLGKGNINLKIIMQRTNTTIIFPDAGDPNIPTIKKGSVSISGAIHNVYLARQQLLGSLPLVMMFDLPDNVDIQDTVVQALQEKNEVTISVKPKARQSNKSVIIKAQERNANGMYQARAQLLNIQENPVAAEIPETYKVPLINNSANYVVSLPTNRSTYLNINTGLANAYGSSPHTPGYINSPYTPNSSLTPVNLAPAYTPTLARPNSPWFGGGPHNQSPVHQTSIVQPPNPPNTPVGGVGLGGLPPNHPYLQDYAMLVLNNITRLQQQQDRDEMERQHQREKQGSWPSPNSSGIAHGFSGSSGMGSSLHSSPHDSPRNSSPVNAAGNLNMHKMDLTNNSTIPGQHTNSSGINTASDISAILSELSVNDRRAPGCEKKVVQIVSAAQGNLSPDYDSKKLLAAKALQHKPAGEPRTPNPVWSGLGFSSSMPESVIREKLQEQNAARQSGQERAGASGGTGPPISGPGAQDWFGQSTQGNGFDALLSKDGSSFPRGLDDLPALLSKQGLSKYTDVFLRHEIDLPTFITLTDDELKEIGIHTFGARKKLLLLASKIPEDKNWPV